MKSMRRRTRVALVALVGMVGGVIAGIADGEGRAGSLALLAAGIVIGEILVLRLEDGTGIPLAYSVVIVLAVSFPIGAVLAATVPAEIVAYFVRVEPRSRRRGLSAVVFRPLVAAAAVGTYRGVDVVIEDEETLATLLVALTAVAVVVLALHEVARFSARLDTSFGARGRMAWLAIATSGMLMAIGYRGVDGGSSVGIWGPLLFSIPLLAAWYAFDRLDSASRTHRQTIEALSLAAEFGGLVREGHAARVASLALAIGRELDLRSDELEHLETAALLHHLGEVTLDDPSHSGSPNTSSEVAAVTAGMLREIGPLSPAGDIVAGEPLTHHRPGRSHLPAYHLPSQVLKVASAFDDMTGGDAVRSGAALEALYSGPGYVYDTRVLDALERVLLDGALAAV